MTEAAFAAAVLNPALPMPMGLLDPRGRPATGRFDIYRNNVVSGLTDVLVAAFPAVVRLVGEEFFRAMAPEFVRSHPPQSRILMLYGAEFPGFLEGFPPVAGLGYLPDVARLEQALREAYHAADAAPVEAAFLVAMQPDRLLRQRLVLQPALRLILSRWPVLGIWRATLTNGPGPLIMPEEAVILRCGYDAEPHLLPLGGHAFLSALQGGAALGQAAEVAGDGFDLRRVFSLLLTAGAIVEVLE